MDLTNVCYGFAQSVGRCVGGGRHALASAREAVTRPLGRLRPGFRRDRIRHIVIEEFTRLVYRDTELTGTELDKRLHVLAETIIVLQERIDGLSTRGPVGEAGRWRETGPLGGTAPVTNDERAILVNIFRQNIALQRPDVVHASVDGNPAGMALTDLSSRAHTPGGNHLRGAGALSASLQRMFSD